MGTVLNPVASLSWRIFLDTCVVNRIVDFGEYFFDGYLAGEAEAEYLSRPLKDQEDVDALYDILQVYRRACMPTDISRTTLWEIWKARKPLLAAHTSELFWHWLDWGNEEIRDRFSNIEFDRLVETESETLGCFPGQADRRLIAEAIVLGCDVFLTVDRRSIWGRRRLMDGGSLLILRPVELWASLRHCAALV